MAKLTLINLAKLAGGIYAALLPVVAGVWWLLVPRMSEAVDRRVNAGISAHVSYGHPESLRRAEAAAAKAADEAATIASAALKQSAATTELVGLLVCRDAGGLPVPASDGHGRCLFTPVSGPPRSIRLDAVDELLADVMGRVRAR